MCVAVVFFSGDKFVFFLSSGSAMCPQDAYGKFHF